jgi:hypothetical protein
MNLSSHINTVIAYYRERLLLLSIRNRISENLEEVNLPGLHLAVENIAPVREGEHLKVRKKDILQIMIV